MDLESKDCGGMRKRVFNEILFILATMTTMMILATATTTTTVSAEKKWEKDSILGKKNNGYFKWDFSAMHLVAIEEYSSTRTTNSLCVLRSKICISVQKTLTKKTNALFFSHCLFSSWLWIFQSDFDRIKSDFFQ